MNPFEPATFFWIAAMAFFVLVPFGARVRFPLLLIMIVTIGEPVLVGNWGGVRPYINWLLGPDRLFLMAVMGLVLMFFYYRQWTKPRAALLILLVFTTAYVASMFDPNFRSIIAKPDNVPITMMIYFVGFFLWLAFRRAAINDERTEKGEPLLEAGSDDKVLVWPDLVYSEMIALVLCSVVIIVWSIVLKAPLEQPANPGGPPNPSKAPWYFLGLQELLVYFDPWIAGVLLPGLIIFGLMALPFIDINPRGNGYYTVKERPFAIFGFLFGFLILWVMLIVFGTFLRGPNWNFFGPFEYWDPHRPAALLNINVSDILWIKILGRALPTREEFGGAYFLIREIPGFILLGLYFLVLPVMLGKTFLRDLYVRMGGIRFHILMQLGLWMTLVPIKMVLRWLFNLKYILSITEWFFNV